MSLSKSLHGRMGASHLNGARTSINNLDFMHSVGISMRKQESKWFTFETISTWSKANIKNKPDNFSPFCHWLRSISSLFRVILVICTQISHLQIVHIRETNFGHNNTVLGSPFPVQIDWRKHNHLMFGKSIISIASANVVLV